MSSNRRRERIPWETIAMWILVIAYAIFFSAASIQKHRAFQSTDFDLGNLSQVIWNTLHGRLFLGTNPEGAQPEISLGIHVRPIFLPISLIYLVWNDPRALLILQSVVIALGAWPVYWLARDALPGRWARNRFHVFPLFFAVVYLLYPALQSANMFDFHPAALAPTLLLLAFYALERERWGWYALWAVLAMACQEDIALVVAMMGFYAWIFRRQWRAGLATLAVSLTWFAVAVGVILPYFDRADASPFASRYGYLGENPLEMALTFVTRPGVVIEALLAPPKLTYLRDLLLPVGFLSLLAPHVLVIGLPPVLTNLLSTKELMHQLEGFHYSVTVVPFVVVSAAYGGAWLVRRFSRPQAQARAATLLAVAVLLCSLIYHLGHGYLPFGERFRWPSVTDHHRLGEAMARQIPGEASVTALPHLHPHASNRALMYAVNHTVDGQLARVDGVEYVWLDVTNSWPIHPNDLKAGVETLLAGDYGVEAAADGWLLLRLGAGEKEMPDAFYDFARASDPQPQVPMHLQFLLDGEPVLESLGFDLQTLHDAQLTFYWRALRPLPPGLRLYPFYFDDGTGQILEDTRLRPMITTVWHPPEDWRVGELVVTRTLPWDVGSEFSVGLGVMQGGDWNGVDQRLPITVESSDQVLRLFDDDTWARLLHVQNGEPVEERRVFDLPTPQHPLDTDFDGQIRLLGYDLDCESLPSTCDLQLYWQAQEPLDTSYTVFAQLLDQDGRVHAQVDAVPQGGGYPTIWWLPGEVVADPLTLQLPADMALDLTGTKENAAAFRLIVGLYDPATGIRLAVSGTDADHVDLLPVGP
jgi:uncharacterized membrane protein